MRKKYFAYGSCVNVESFKGTLKNAECEADFHICGVGRLNGYRLAFTRRSTNWGGCVLDVIDSADDYVLGVVYDIPEEAVSALDRREGAPHCYRREDGFKIELGFEQVDVFTYTVVDKALKEFKPSADYFNLVYRGMVHRFPAEYVNKYLIDHCNDLGMRNKRIPETNLYHDNGSTGSHFIKDNPEFYYLIKQMALFFGDDNNRVETVQPTSEMFRLLVKCTEIAARCELDFGHRIPRGLYNCLASEFQRISGVKTARLPVA
ncbi:MAG TPA: gamma-glutamylcyclotransferase [Fervidobacterium sp.]|jgi:cation transport regulator ChaC|nr:gamma-glutamylcyclotransferase [Bacillota bacterium]HUM43858.1 gamma-glutamylcyclotransferase [Fervidobacterium sp.]